MTKPSLIGGRIMNLHISASPFWHPLHSEPSPEGQISLLKISSMLIKDVFLLPFGGLGLGGDGVINVYVMNHK